MEFSRTASRCLQLKPLRLTASRQWQAVSPSILTQRAISQSSRCAAEKPVNAGGSKITPGLGWGRAGLGGNTSRTPSSALGRGAGKTDVRYDLSKMTLPTSSSASPASQSGERHEALMHQISKAFSSAVPEKPSLRLVPSIGRTVALRAGTPPSVAFTRLDSIVRRDRIKQQQIGGKFYIRPGVKRKQQKSERWRMRFKTAFQATVSRVGEMKRQGW